MPESHTIHRLAAECLDRFAGRPVRVGSPQGKFADAAALLDGSVLEAVEAHGKHLFLGFDALGPVRSGGPGPGEPGRAVRTAATGRVPGCTSTSA